MDFKPERISKCASIEVNGQIEKVFPLFGPVLEKEWADGWDPEIIFSKDPLVEEHMIFRTPLHAGENFHTWVITQFDTLNHKIEYTVSTSNRIWFIKVECKPARSKTMATICYTYTGLTSEGNELNQVALKKMFANDLKDWQEALNYYLENGKKLIYK